MYWILSVTQWHRRGLQRWNIRFNYLWNVEIRTTGRFRRLRWSSFLSDRFLWAMPMHCHSTDERWETLEDALLRSVERHLPIVSVWLEKVKLHQLRGQLFRGSFAVAKVLFITSMSWVLRYNSHIKSNYRWRISLVSKNVSCVKIWSDRLRRVRFGGESRRTVFDEMESWLSRPVHSLGEWGICRLDGLRHTSSLFSFIRTIAVSDPLHSSLTPESKWFLWIGIRCIPTGFVGWW